MPKGLNLKSFGRRKSSGNVLDFDPDAAPAAAAAATTAPATSSFRVLERSDKKPSTYGSQPVTRPFNSPLRTLRGKSADDLTSSHPSRPGWPLTGARGSGGTTNSGSSGYYDSSSASARHSSTSTLPSSVDQDRSPDHNEELFPPTRKPAKTGMFQSVAPGADAPPAPPPSFTSRAARALSFGKQSASRGSREDPPPPIPPPHNTYHDPPINPVRSYSPHRERAMTTSSYASTAVPAKTELTLGSADLGLDFGKDDFSNMFDTLKKSDPPQASPPVGSFHRTESEPMFPPRTYSRQALTPSPNALKLAQSARKNSESPYHDDDRSSERLLASPALSSPNTVDGNAPGPAVGNGIAQAFLGNSKPGYSRVPERYNSPGPERSNSVDSYSSITDNAHDAPTAFPNRQLHVDDSDRFVRRYQLSDGPSVSSPPSPKPGPSNLAAPSLQSLNTAQARGGATRRGGTTSPQSAQDESLLFSDSNTTTPRAARMQSQQVDGSTSLNSSPAGPPSRAVRPTAQPHQRTESGTVKKMTTAEFQKLRSRAESSAEQSEEEDLSDNDYDDDDEIERARRIGAQRQKQEANMSVYRQQMKKVTGGGPTDLPSSAASTVRPSMDRGSTAPASGGMGLHLGGIGGTPPSETVRGKQDGSDDEDVPLGILQAHGFPSGSRPPTRLGENDLQHQRRTSVAGSTVMNGGAGQGNLPPFARRLPQDPYFGAGLVNQSTRESLAMNNSAGSVYGMPSPQAPAMGHPGGLVGVIAGEERAKAARRGSPNVATGTYNPMGNMPLPPNMSMPPQMPPMPRTMSMGNVAPPTYNPSGAPPMPMMPQMSPFGMPQMQQPPMDASQQQMQQFMSMQMQLMQNMLQMQQAQMGQGGPQTPQPQQQHQQQTGDYLGVSFDNNGQRPMSMASQGQPQLNGGRAMTMMNPPTGWAQAPQPGGQRPNSAMPTTGNSYAPSVNGLHMAGGGPGPGYTPSIAPSERSTVGMPSRYRPVTQNGEPARSQSMTSSLTLQAFTNQQTSPNLAGTTYNGNTTTSTPKSTIRVVDKPKGGAKVASRPVDEDEDDGWADMRKKRESKKKSMWSRKDKQSTASEPTLSDLYQGLE